MQTRDTAPATQTAQITPATPTTEERGTVETITVEAAELLERSKQLVHEGNVRRITIKQGEHVVVELPLTVGVVAAR